MAFRRSRERASMRRAAAMLVTATLAFALASACGSAADSAVGTPSSLDGGSNGDAASTTADGGGVPGEDLVPANGLVLVHAAAFPPFRICFEGTPDERPAPASDVMPDSNVVGVDVGAAVRLEPPRTATLGRAFVFAEPKIRALYPAFGGNKGPTCKQLLQSGADAVSVGNVDADLTRGVNLLVLRGCGPAIDEPSASIARCGPTWSPATGNLAVDMVPVKAYARRSPTQLRVQVVQLSRDLEVHAGSRALGLAFGALDGGAPAPFVEGAAPLGTPVPDPPALLDYGDTDVAEYATSGLFVTLGPDLDAGSSDAAAARDVVLAQSLADIQRRSSPRALPPEWFAQASSYVVLSIGELEPTAGDGGASDPRRALHLLAVPLAGADAGADAAAP